MARNHVRVELRLLTTLQPQLKDVWQAYLPDLLLPGQPQHKERLQSTLSAIRRVMLSPEGKSARGFLRARPSKGAALTSWPALKPQAASSG